MDESLPEREGITDNINSMTPGETEPTPEETKVYQTDEYIESGEESGRGVPGQLPAGATESGAGESSALESSGEESEASSESGAGGESASSEENEG